MTIERLDLTALDEANNEGYGTWPLPTVRDEEIGALVELMTRTRDHPVEPSHVFVLLAYAERMATLARRNHHLESLRLGLKAASLVSQVGEHRELLLVMPLLWRTAEALGLDPETEFHSVAEPDRLDPLHRFAARQPADRTIESMGYVEVNDDLGFRYERTW